MLCQWWLRQQTPLSRRGRKDGKHMMTWDYNGWNDAPEDEREWFDQHPEIWGGPTRDADKRPYRVTAADRRRGPRA